MVVYVHYQHRRHHHQVAQVIWSQNHQYFHQGIRETVIAAASPLAERRHTGDRHEQRLMSRRLEHNAKELEATKKEVSERERENVCVCVCMHVYMYIYIYDDLLTIG